MARIGPKPRQGFRELPKDLAVWALWALIAVACSGESPPAEREVAEPVSTEPMDIVLEPDPWDHGFGVWESNRGGDWRLWLRRLDARHSKQLSPEEGSRQHCCPHISPDGRTVAYLSLPKGQERYPESGAAGVLRLIGADGEDDRVAAAAARTYFEHRAVVWRSARELIYIGGDGRTRLLDIESGAEQVLVDEAGDAHGWLLDATFSHATKGSPGFGRYDRAGRRVEAGRPYGGCQPYFSHDGRWGFWIAGAGGPIRRIELGSGAVDTVLRKGDPRLPQGRGYLYFPMLSRDGTLLAWAASDGTHDHQRADYEVFVAEADPETFEVLGPPLQLSEHPKTDRFPDVFPTPLALGRHFGEAPLRLTFAAKEPGDWIWRFGDHSKLELGQQAEHTFETPGLFHVTANRGRETLRGRVWVRAPSPPSVEPGPEASSWPVDREGLVFLWQTANHSNRVEREPAGSTNLAALGRAWPDRHFAMDLRGGRFVADKASMERLFHGCRATNELTLELVVHPAPSQASETAVLMDFSGSPRSRNFWLAQRGGRLFWRLRTPYSDDQSGPPVDLGAVPVGRASHVVLTYSPGQLAFYLNGKLVRENEVLQGGFFHWQPRPLLFGDAWRGGHAWHGVLEGIAVHDHVLSHEAVGESFRRYAAEYLARDKVSRRSLRARLEAHSTIPTLDEIAPYREALAVYEYTSEASPGERLRVVHRILADGDRLPAAERSVGQTYELELEPFASHPELESLYLSETLPERYDLELFYDDRFVLD